MEDKSFKSVFEGLQIAIDKLDSESEKFNVLNEKLEIEINKTKKYNLLMLIISLVSLTIGVGSLLASFLI